MTKTHLILIPFTGVGKIPYRGDEWFRDRIEVFKNYTLKSLLNQTSRDFTLWLSFREEERESQLVSDLEVYLTQKQVRYQTTFYGLMYHDDRNEERNLTLEYRLKLALAEWNMETDFVYLTRLDSDDMLSKMAVDHIQHGLAAMVEALVFRKGYIYNQELDQLAKWEPPTNPPFHTLIMPKETFLDPRKHLAFYKNFKSHEDIVEQFSYLTLPDYQYCVFTHNPTMHISTNFNHKFRGELIPEQDKLAILKEFGI